METKITVIIDNMPGEGLDGEWGLSFLVDHNGRRTLVDTGSSELFADNLIKLGYDIKDVEYGTLSHAHYDHANGIPRFFEDNKEASFYIRKGTRANCYDCKEEPRYIGIPEEILSRYIDRVTLIEGDYRLYDGAWLIPHKTDNLAEIGRQEHMFRKTEAGWEPDDFSHEQSLVLDTDKGLVVINSCSHGGAVNIIREIRESFPDKKVYGLIGGFHLYNKTEDYVRRVSDEIEKTGIEFICTGHCTEAKACSIMKEMLGDRMHILHAGMVMTF